MKRMVSAMVVFLSIFWFTGLGLAAGIPGATDKVQGASLLVPFFEVGINDSTHPENTLLVLWAINTPAGGITIHYHVWDIDGNAVSLYGNVELSNTEGWSTSMRDLIASASPSVKSALTDAGEDYYRGFVTIDVVTEDTTKSPIESGYPLGTGNYLEGWIYYTRLAEGSTNGLTMIPIEEVGTGVDTYLHGFYSSSDGREEIDVEARACAAALATGDTCSAHANISTIRSRVFLDDSFNASTRIIVFLWDPGVTEGISQWCDTEGCDTTYDYWRYDENGNRVQDTSISLNHVVNVIKVEGNQNGFVTIAGIPSGAGDWQVYAFSLTNAEPPSGASANWDAILESYIKP
jgi:hypothetical protein